MPQSSLQPYGSPVVQASWQLLDGHETPGGKRNTKCANMEPLQRAGSPAARAGPVTWHTGQTQPWSLWDQCHSLMPSMQYEWSRKPVFYFWEQLSLFCFFHKSWQKFMDISLELLIFSFTSLLALNFTHTNSFGMLFCLFILSTLNVAFCKSN